MPPLPRIVRERDCPLSDDIAANNLGERVEVRGNDRCRRNMRASRSLGITIRNWRIAGSRTVRLAPSPRPSPPRKTTATLLELGTRFLVVFSGGEGATGPTLLKTATRANLLSTITVSSAQGWGEVMNSSSSCEQICCATRSLELTTINELLDLPPLPQTNRGVWIDRCLEANAICLGERVGVG